MTKLFKSLSRILLLLGFLYLFLLSIGLLGAVFKGFGKEFANILIATTSNPFVGLFVGILATSLVQSSSTTTSIIVGLCASGALTIGNAVPMIMGANIGTTITNSIVSLGCIGRKEDFRRAFAGATIHDFFNLMVVCILLPLEIATHYLERTAGFLAVFFEGSAAFNLTSPIKLIIKPVIHSIKGMLFVKLGVPHMAGSIVMLALSGVLLFVSLYFMMRVMRSVVAGKVEMVFDRIIGRNALLAMFMGMCATAAVQSSSITTSMLVPMIGAGIITVEQAFPITLGANIGTTVTALLASLTGNIAGVTIAFCHLLFNITGILLIYPVKRIRRIPIMLAKALADISVKKKRYAFFFILGIFFVIPTVLIFLSRFLGR